MAEKLYQIQQGDVLLQQVSTIPIGAVRIPNECQVAVAHGEKTGHNHVIRSDQASLWTLTKDDVTQLYLQVLTPVTIFHDEHKPVPVPIGTYHVGRVKEYDYFAEMERQLED